MTVLLILATFAIFLAIDFFLGRKRAPKVAFEGASAKALAPRPVPSIVAGFRLPETLRYHPGHAWARPEGPQAVRVGVDDFGARLIGRADKVSLPLRGRWIRQGQTLMVVERDGRKVEVLSPMEGMVTGVNERVLAEPALALRDPYGEGWLVTVQSPDATTNFRNLLGGGVARRWMEEAATRLRAMKLGPEGSGGAAPALALAQDGGLAVDDLSREIPGAKWDELAREFFLS